MQAGLRFALIGTLLYSASCGPDDSGPLPDDEEIFEPVAVVVTVDFPDVYGPIEMDTEGHGSFLLDEDSDFDCENPTFILEGRDAAFRAVSSRHFYWKGVVQREEHEGCLILPLNSKTMGSGVLYFTHKDFRLDCFPIDLFLSADGGEEEWMGSILYSGELIELAPPYGRGVKEAEIFKAVRRGRAVAVGGGPGEPRTYRYRLPGPCGGTSNEVNAPYHEEEIQGSSTSVSP